MSIDLRGTEVLVVGAGIMGAGIVQVAALAGHPVKLFDMREGAAAQALAQGFDRRRQNKNAHRLRKHLAHLLGALPVDFQNHVTIGLELGFYPAA